MDNNEYFGLSRKLEEFHTIFYKMWEIGEPVFDDLVDTACVVFDKDGNQLSYHFHPDFWAKLNEYERCFVIVHECLHILLNHGSRMKKYRINPQLTNIAMDVAVNETALNNMGFIRDQLGENFKDMITCERLWPDEDVPTDESAEFYYEKLYEGAEKIPSYYQFDVHGDISSEDLKKAIEENLTGEEAEAINDFLEKVGDQGEPELDENGEPKRGANKGGMVFKVKAKYNPKKKWETVIKKWSLKYKPELRTVEQWTQRSRRMNTLPTDLFIPSDYDDDTKSEDMIEVYFYQDTSGSCAGFRDRFFAAAMTLPKNRFKIRMFCFDTSVYETTLESGKLYGFGGTSFDIIENHIQSNIKKEGVKYPEAVFVITDGYGNEVQPQHPKKWSWFLSDNYTRCIPKECNTFMLKDYE